MDVEKTGRDVTEKKLFSFTESTADHFFIREGKDRGRIVHRIWVGGGGGGRTGVLRQFLLDMNPLLPYPQNSANVYLA